ncbi:L-2-amino-thiazoline-4-carboxylic acid hydrolase [Halovenus salina]|uniref:L-2-amino-thiazoline-4-carboxylic acid hydrolase n=1 Tax=Halovenus salina TaxID=1510225 RepID=A0ABD5W801_9EURY|nr:L-2-amino-thiazoline-4-carboxylic acid hydrolase [Halovenus salina]
MPEIDRESAPRDQKSKEFHETEKFDPQQGEMEQMGDLKTLMDIREILADELGEGTATKIIVKAFFWDPTFKKPNWRPDAFEFPSQEMQDAFKKIFDDMVPFICLFRRIKQHCDEETAQLLMAESTVPATVPYLEDTFKSHPHAQSINPLRHDMRDYLGTGDGFEWTEKVSEDGREVKYQFTRCGYIEVMQEYGLDYAASMACYCDHIHFDVNTPELFFKRDHCIGEGDDYCDHHYILKSSAEDYDDMDKYGDTENVEYDARELIDRWKHEFQ